MPDFNRLRRCLTGPAPLVSALALLGLSGCLVGPNYKRPSAPTSVAFKEAEGWAPANPSDAAERRDWWTVFGDPLLDNLEGRVVVSNQTLKADEAAYREAHAIVAEDRAALFPTVALSGAASASGTGVTKPSHVYQPQVGASWAPDIWGAVRRQIESARASAQANFATLVNARLSIQTELAVDYISLRQTDEENRIYDSEVADYSRTLQITRNKYAVGNAPRSDVLSAQSALQSAQAGQADLERQRANLEHAIALLVGAPPADLTIPPAAWSLKLPEIPASVPSTLLQRRPDIAAAERDTAAANALIGVQVAAYYPNLSLSAAGGFSSSSLGRLFSAPASYWSVGAQLADTIFDAGLRGARVAEARAAYDQAVANYRQTVLTAFGQVEDNLAAQRVYASEQALYAAALSTARANETITRNEYAAGTVDFTTVLSAEQAALTDRNIELQVEANRLSTAVALIEALGGGWNATSLPKD